MSSGLPEGGSGGGGGGGEGIGEGVDGVGILETGTEGAQASTASSLHANT